MKTLFLVHASINAEKNEGLALSQGEIDSEGLASGWGWEEIKTYCNMFFDKNHFQVVFLLIFQTCTVALAPMNFSPVHLLEIILGSRVITSY